MRDGFVVIACGILSLTSSESNIAFVSSGFLLGAGAIMFIIAAMED